jgi:hypothetical protein
VLCQGELACTCTRPAVPFYQILKTLRICRYNLTIGNY